MSKLNFSSLMDNFILRADSYKFSHYKQNPKGIEAAFAYIEPRTDDDDIMFFGLQYYLKQYLSIQITTQMIDEAEELSIEHGVPFNREDWEYIVEKHNGYLPIKIRAVREGQVYKSHNPLVTIESTDTRVAWLVSYIETLLLKVWYPITVASNSYKIKRKIQWWNEKTSDNAGATAFQLQDFGYRGASSEETAGIGGLAHLLNFRGTDTTRALVFGKVFYNIRCAGYSIPASEHSIATALGREGEMKIVMNNLEEFKGSPLLAQVADSYDVYNWVRNVTSGEFKEKIESDTYPKLIIRPDSGMAVEVIEKILDIMEENEVAFTKNSKGYKVFNKYGIIWSDGINQVAIESILEVIARRGYSSDIIAFGMGGALLQRVTRDDYAFAEKTSAIKINGEWFDIFKAPIDDPMKKSKAGKVKFEIDGVDQMTDVFENGRILVDYNFEDIRN